MHIKQPWEDSLEELCLYFFLLGSIFVTEVNCGLEITRIVTCELVKIFHQT